MNRRCRYTGDASFRIVSAMLLFVLVLLVGGSPAQGQGGSITDPPDPNDVILDQDNTWAGFNNFWQVYAIVGNTQVLVAQDIKGYTNNWTVELDSPSELTWHHTFAPLSITVDVFSPPGVSGTFIVYYEWGGAFGGLQGYSKIFTR